MANDVLRPGHDLPRRLNVKPFQHIVIAGLNRSGKTTLTKQLLLEWPQRFYIIDPLDQYAEFGAVGSLKSGAKRYIPAEESSLELEGIAETLHRQGYERTTLVIEECEGFLPQGKGIPYWTSSLFRRGPNWGCGTISVTRRIADLEKKLFDRVHHLFLFRSGPQSWGYISRLIGGEYVRRSQKDSYNDLKHDLISLPKYHFFHFDFDNDQQEIVHLEL